MIPLFLDFDGVFFTVGGCVHQRIESGDEKAPRWELDPVSLSLLKRLCRDFPEIRLVISSTWRLGTSLEELREILGPELGKLVIGKTPSSRSGYRGFEIKVWLDENKNLDIQDIIILDDDSDMHPFMGFLFQTNSYDGFQSTDWMKLERYLKSTEKQKRIRRIKMVLKTFVRHSWFDLTFRIRMLTWRTERSWIMKWLKNAQRP